MNKDYVPWVMLCVVIIAILWVRMELATSTPALSYDSYLTVRHVEHIKEFGTPIRDDPQSVTGNHRVSNPFFAYLLAALTSVSDHFWKLLSNLFMVLLLIPIYFIARDITWSSWAALPAVLLAASAPIAFSSFLNTPSPTPIALLLFFIILALLHDPDKYLRWIIVSCILLTFLHPLVFVLVITFVMIIILLRVEGYGIDQRMVELFFFTLLLGTWFYVIIYKKALFSEGVQVLWQNLPSQYVAISFGSVTFLTVLYSLGIITFFFGTFGVYHALFENRNRSAYTVICGIVAVVIMLLLRMMPLDTGTILLAFLLSIMASYGLMVTTQYIRRTKFPWMIYPLTCVVLFFFLFSAILPALVSAKNTIVLAPSSQDIAAYQALQEELPDQVVLLTTVQEAAAVQYFSKKTTLTDDDFLLVQNGDELIEDIDAVYTARFRSNIVGKAKKLGFTYILFSSSAKSIYGREEIAVHDPYCLPATKVGIAQIYALRCGVE